MAVVRPDPGVAVFRVNEAVCLLPPFEDIDIDLHFQILKRLLLLGTSLWNIG